MICHSLINQSVNYGQTAVIEKEENTSGHGGNNPLCIRLHHSTLNFFHPQQHARSFILHIARKLNLAKLASIDTYGVFLCILAI